MEGSQQLPGDKSPSEESCHKYLMQSTSSRPDTIAAQREQIKPSSIIHQPCPCAWLCLGDALVTLLCLQLQHHQNQGSKAATSCKQHSSRTSPYQRPDISTTPGTSGTSRGQSHTEPEGNHLQRSLPRISCQAESQLCLTMTPLTLALSGNAGDFSAPKIEMCSQLLSLVQEKFSIPCLESFLLLIII